MSKRKRKTARGDQALAQHFNWWGQSAALRTATQRAYNTPTTAAEGEPKPVGRGVARMKPEVRTMVHPKGRLARTTAPPRIIRDDRGRFMRNPQYEEPTQRTGDEARRFAASVEGWY